MSTLPPLPEWSLRDDLGELVPSEIRVALRAYATAALSAQAAEVEALRKRAETWELLYMRAINEANGLTNYVEDRPELSKIERKLVAIEAAARAALKEQTPNAALTGAEGVRVEGTVMQQTEG